MTTALVLEADGRRVNGRWTYGSVTFTKIGKSDTQRSQRLTEAGIVLDFKPDLAAR